MAREKPGMSYGDIAMVLARALKDPVFRQRLTTDPVKALKRGYPEFTPGPETVKFFMALKSDAFDAAADALNAARDPIDGAGDMAK
jgi:hypothetical protein